MSILTRMKPRLAAALVAALTTVCTPDPGPAPLPEVRIGLLALTTGEYEAPSGRPTLQGAELAAAEINAGGGIPVGGVNFQIRLVERGHSELTEEVSTMALRLINLDSVHVLVGPQLSQHAIPVARLANDAHVPMISPMSSNVETTAGKPFVFRLAFLDAVQGDVLAHFAHSELGLSRAAVIMDRTDPYSRDLCARFTEAFDSVGGDPVVETFAGAADPDPDFRPTLRRLHDQGVRAVMLPVRPSFVLATLKQAEELGFHFTFLGSDSWDGRMTRSLPAAQGSFITHQWQYDFPSEEARRFAQAYQARFGEEPRATAAMTYDAIYVAAKAIQRAGRLDGDAIRDAIASLPPFEGATGTIDFRGSSDPVRSVVISAIEGGTMRIREVVPTAR